MVKAANSLPGSVFQCCNLLSNGIHFNPTSKRRHILCTGPTDPHIGVFSKWERTIQRRHKNGLSESVLWRDRSLLESAVKALQSPSELLCGSRPTFRYPCDRQGQLVPLFLRLSNNRIGFGRSSKWVQDFLESMEHELLTTRRQVWPGRFANGDHRSCQSPRVVKFNPQSIPSSRTKWTDPMLNQGGPFHSRGEGLWISIPI